MSCFIIFVKNQLLMIVSEKIIILSSLQKKLTDYIENGTSEKLNDAISNSIQHNKWFTQDFVIKAIRSISYLLSAENLNKWKQSQGQIKSANVNKIAVIMAGNIPLVGFHDFLCVYITGNMFIGKLSTQDKFLLPFIAQEIINIAPEEKKYFEFAETRLPEFDAIIATGSNNSARYFEHYFNRYPHIIRKSRSSIAVLTGNESKEELNLLMDDIFLYFGLGCRNVSKIYVPRNYDFTPLIKAMDGYKDILWNHNKYMNNYEYYKTIFLLNQIPFTDIGYSILQENSAISSPISVLHYEFYDDRTWLNEEINKNREKIQCVVAKEFNLNDTVVSFGKSQKPELWDYADGVNTIQFLNDMP